MVTNSPRPIIVLMISAVETLSFSASSLTVTPEWTVTGPVGRTTGRSSRSGALVAAAAALLALARRPGGLGVDDDAALLALRHAALRAATADRCGRLGRQRGATGATAATRAVGARTAGRAVAARRTAGARAAGAGGARSTVGALAAVGSRAALARREVGALPTLACGRAIPIAVTVARRTVLGRRRGRRRDDGLRVRVLHGGRGRGGRGRSSPGARAARRGGASARSWSRPSGASPPVRGPRRPRRPCRAGSARRPRTGGVRPRSGRALVPLQCP